MGCSLWFNFWLSRGFLASDSEKDDCLRLVDTDGDTGLSTVSGRMTADATAL